MTWFQRMYSGVVAAHLAAPVVDRPEPLQAGLELLDAGVGEDPGMDPGLDGGVLGRQAEAVEPDGAEHGVALHGALADQQVTEGVVADVALMGGAARVGVHAEHVVGRARVVVVDLVGAVVGPAPLPFGLDRLGVVLLCHDPPGYRRRPGAPYPICDDATGGAAYLTTSMGAGTDVHVEPRAQRPGRPEHLDHPGLGGRRAEPGRHGPLFVATSPR